LNQKHLYLWINLLSFIVPFIFSFYPKANFSKKWKFVLPAIAITAILFITWDALFTKLGVWGFNPRYTMGIDVFGLPVEEVLSMCSACQLKKSFFSSASPMLAFLRISRLTT
jgi:lycopene cyclase domain-containing protein